MNHREYLAKIGAKGGATKGPTKARTKAQARKAAQIRWAKRKRTPRRARKAGEGKG